MEENPHDEPKTTAAPDKNLLSPANVDDENEIILIMAGFAPPRAPTATRRVTPIFPAGYALPEAEGQEEWLSKFPLRARGRNLITHNTGERFKLSAINWYGASDCCHVVGGLDVAPLKNICGAIKAMGFNTVRLPWSNEMLRISERNIAAAADAAAAADSHVESRAIPLASIDLSLNPELRAAVRNDNPLAVFDAVIAGLGALHIAVILNNHTTIGMWSGGVERNGMWFDEGSEYTEEQWVADWVSMADRYRHLPFVIGYDLRNEVRPTSLLRSRAWPFWGGSSSAAPLPPPSPPTGASENEPPASGNEENADTGGALAAASKEADARKLARRWSLAAAPAATKANKQQQKRNPEADWCRAAGEASRALLLANKAPGFIVVERIAWPQRSVADMLGSAAAVNPPSTKDPRGSDLGPPFWACWECPRDRFVIGVHAYSWSGPGAWSPREFTGGALSAALRIRDSLAGRKLYGEFDELALEALLDEEWGFALDNDIIPIFFSEFGASLSSTNEMKWFKKITHILMKKDVDHSYWPLNSGAKPTRPGQRGNGEESYGLLNVEDWTPNFSDDRLHMLRRLSGAQLPAGMHAGMGSEV